MDNHTKTIQRLYDSYMSTIRQLYDNYTTTIRQPIRQPIEYGCRMVVHYCSDCGHSKYRLMYGQWSIRAWLDHYNITTPHPSPSRLPPTPKNKTINGLIKKLTGWLLEKSGTQDLDFVIGHAARPNGHNVTQKCGQWSARASLGCPSIAKTNANEARERFWRERVHLR